MYWSSLHTWKLEAKLRNEVMNILIKLLETGRELYYLLPPKGCRHEAGSLKLNRKFCANYGTPDYKQCGDEQKINGSPD